MHEEEMNEDGELIDKRVEGKTKEKNEIKGERED
jgi:hypothetical protein